MTIVLSLCLETETEAYPTGPHPRLQHRRRGSTQGSFNMPSLKPMRIIFNFIRTCKTHWEWAHGPKCALWDHIAAKYHIRTIKELTGKDTQVPMYEIIRMNLTEECRVCNAPRAQIRRGMGMRCCSYCFENLTVPHQALKLITNFKTSPVLEEASLKSARTEWRYVSSGSSGRKKKREMVYFLPDLLHGSLKATH